MAVENRNSITLVVVGFFLGLPFMAAGYEQDVHLTVTYWLAEMAGFSAVDSLEIAKYDQATDDDPETQPLTSASFYSPLGIERRQLYHFVNSERIRTLRDNAYECTPDRITNKQYRNIGLFLHAFEDLYSHRGYDYEYGHLLAGHGPDKPWNNPSVTQAMVTAKFNALKDLRERCAPHADEARPNFVEVERRLEQWAQEEQLAGVRGDNLSPSRWSALMSMLYGEAYTARVSGGYQKWLKNQKSGGWKKP